MKKVLSILLIVSLLLGCTSAFSEGMGVKVIGGPDVETEPVSLDDFKLDNPVTIDGFGIFTGTYFGFIDSLGYYRQGANGCTYYYNNDAYVSGADAEYAMLKMDITNLATKTKNFLDQCEVKAIYDDLYEYGGWCYQFNHNNKNADGGGTQSTDDVIDKADQFSIDPMYAGHYCFGCTLPNAVVSGKKSLKLVITIDGNEITYNIRK